MRIVSWNVNGLRACARKGFADWLAASDAEIVGIQEVRARRDQLDAELACLGDWHVDIVAAEKAGYSGVGLLSRRPADAIDSALGRPEFDAEGRLQMARFGALSIVNGYFPNGNGKNRDLSRIPYKLDFYRAVFEALEARKERGEPILVMGDLNTAPHEIDLARPKQNRETSGFRPEERDELLRWLDAGWVDTFRHFEPTASCYTWWSQRRGVRERNIGWRIDFILASPGAMPYVRAAAIHADVMGSDHCPISVDIDATVMNEPPSGSRRRTSRRVGRKKTAS